MPVCTLQDWHSHWIEFISKRQSAAKTTKYSSTRITTLVFVHYYASTYSFFHKHTRSFSSFLIYNTIIFHTFFRSLFLALSLSLSLLFSDRNHITKFTNITHSQKNEPCYTRIVAYKRRKIVAQQCYWLNSKSNIITMIRSAFLFCFWSHLKKRNKKVNWKPRIQARHEKSKRMLQVYISILNINDYFDVINFNMFLLNLVQWL